jgi:hypothetical protein
VAWVHGIWQIVTWFIAIVGLGLGIWLANNSDEEFVCFNCALDDSSRTIQC